MLTRSLAIWFLLLGTAIINGAVRATWIIPRTGEYLGHVISSFTLSGLIVALAWATIGWMGPAATADALRVGGLWLVLTVAFEFLAGHFLFGSTWEHLLADYNLAAGRIWLLVLVVTAFSPLIAMRLRSL